MSAQIRLERKAYYDMLEATQKGGLDITPWLEWFLGCLDRAFDGAEKSFGRRVAKARFLGSDTRTARSMNGSAIVINRLLDGFEGSSHHPNGR